MKDKLINAIAIIGSTVVMLLSALPYILGCVLMWLAIKWLLKG